jgi:hypothetical protein
MIVMDSKKQQAEADSLRRLTFASVAVGTAAILTCIIVVPMLYGM